jgi:hypothetical protein
MKKFLAALVAVLACSASAMADLNGTNMTLSVNHAGLFSGVSAITDQSYAYGSPANFLAAGWGTLNVNSPAPAPGYDNALTLDFTNFSYSTFAGFPSVGTVTLKNIAEAPDLASVKVLVNGFSIGYGVMSATGGFQASWNTASVFTFSPDTPHVIVAWNSVPAPGALALLGLAGVAGRARRRR